MSIEVIEGPMAGTKMVNVYTPQGRRTGIDVYGDFTVAQLAPGQVEAAVRANLEKVFEEDSAAIRAFAKP